LGHLGRTVRPSVPSVSMREACNGQSENGLKSDARRPMALARGWLSREATRCHVAGDPNELVRFSTGCSPGRPEPLSEDHDLERGRASRNLLVAWCTPPGSNPEPHLRRLAASSGCSPASFPTFGNHSRSHSRGAPMPRRARSISIPTDPAPFAAFVARFMSHIIEDPDPAHCWLWKGTINSKRYPCSALRAPLR
jgi:hypothetical protein